MPDYESDPDDILQSQSDEEVEYDKKGNTIVKPKVDPTVKSVDTLSASIDLTIAEDTATAAKSDNKILEDAKTLNKSQQKKLESVGDQNQRKKMAKEMMRKKKSQVVNQYTDTGDV